MSVGSIRVKLEEKKVFTVKNSKGTVLGEFVEESNWNGFTKLVSRGTEKHSLIVHDPRGSGLGAFMHIMFNTSVGDREVVALCASDKMKSMLESTDKEEADDS